MNGLGKRIRYAPSRIKDLDKDQLIRLNLSLEIFMGVLSELEWEEHRLYTQLTALHTALQKARKS